MAIIRGRTQGFWEQGTEGIFWAVYEDGKDGYDGLHVLGQGQHVRIWDANDALAFDGSIDKDARAGWAPSPPPNPSGGGQPMALGCWIHWTQRGWEPDDWAGLFLVSPFEDRLLRAEIDAP